MWNQCYYDPDRGCFKHFATNCDMEIAACKHNQGKSNWDKTPFWILSVNSHS